MSNEFGKQQLFMGAGDQSLAYVGYLHQQLGRSITTLGGIQQPPTCTDPVKQHERDVKDGEDEVERIAKEICVALTGKKPRFDKPHPIEAWE